MESIDGSESAQGSPKSLKSSKRSSESEEENEHSKKPCVAAHLSSGDISPSSGSQSSTLHPRYAKDFNEEGPLGQGGYGFVFECYHKLDGLAYAVKKIPFADHQLDRVLREVRIMAPLQHPSIIRYHQCWIEDGAPNVGSSISDQEMVEGATKTLMVAMELCDSTMHTAIEKNKISESDAQLYFKEILDGLRFIHNSGVIHGDLSRDNIFISKGHAKIGDFGKACYGGEDPVTVSTISLGNPIYLAPEISEDLDHALVSKKADMFALGLILFEMTYKMISDFERSEKFQLLKTGNIDAALDNVEDMLNKEMIRDLVHVDPIRRLSASDFIQRYFP